MRARASAFVTLARAEAVVGNIKEEAGELALVLGYNAGTCEDIVGALYVAPFVFSLGTFFL